MSDPSLRPAAPPSNRIEVLATIGLVLALVAFVVVRRIQHRLAPHPSREECSALLDRYVEHLARATEPTPASSAIAQRRREARATADGDPDFATCPQALTREQADCAMAAPNADEFERCLE